MDCLVLQLQTNSVRMPLDFLALRFPPLRDQQGQLSEMRDEVIRAIAAIADIASSRKLDRGYVAETREFRECLRDGTVEENRAEL